MLSDREQEVLEKASKRGAGSRGGHVIGHTKSGKPIYRASDLHKLVEEHTSKFSYAAKDRAVRDFASKFAEKYGAAQSFTSADHRDAADLYLEHHDAHPKAKEADLHHALAAAHSRQHSKVKKSEEPTYWAGNADPSESWLWKSINQ